MTRIELAPEVLDDFDRFFEHIAQFDAGSAPQRIGEILDAIQILTHSPLIGRPVKDGKRELVIGRATRERAALQLVHLREQKPDEKFEIEDTPTYQAWKKEVNEHFTEEIDELKFAASSAYDLAIQENQSRKRSRQTLHLLVSSCRRGTTHQTPKPNRMHVYANA